MNLYLGLLQKRRQILTSVVTVLAGAAIGAEYGATVGGVVRSVAGAGIGFYIENTYWKGIKYFDNFMQKDGWIHSKDK